MYKHVLVAVDLAHGAVGEHIVKIGRLLAGSDGRVTLMNAIQPLPSYIGLEAHRGDIDRHRSETERQLKALAGNDPKVETVIAAAGQPATAILDEAKTRGADVIVIGAHRPDLTDYLLGSTASRIVRHAKCTVVVERSHETS